MDQPPPTLCAVIVTYGARGHLASKVLSSLASNPNLHAVVVHNGPTTPLTAPDGVQQLYLPENLGSAGGYARGIEAALRTRCPYILLLDDDNAPQAGAVDKLLASVKARADDADQSLFAALAFRQGRFRKTAKGFARSATSAFLGLDLKDGLVRLLGKFRRGQSDEKREPIDPSGGDDLPFCAYGGLLAHRSTFEQIGLPREDMVLYADDHEYTHRIVARGGRIWLVRDAVIDDIDLMDERLATRKSTSVLARMIGRLKAKPDFRLFYGVRNHVWLGMELNRSNRAAYYLNACIYLIALTVLAALLWRWGNYSVLMRAVGDGFNQRGGLAEDFPLPSAAKA